MKAAAAIACVAFALAGCIAVQPISAARATGNVALGVSAAADARADADFDVPIWPERWGDDDAAPGVIVPVDGPFDAWSPRRQGPWHHRLPKGDDEAIVRALAEGRAEGRGYRYRMEGAGAFIYERDPDAPAPPQNQPAGRDEPAFMFVFASGRIDRTDSAPDAEPRVDVGRTWFAYYDHRRGGAFPNADPGRGTVMLLPGLFGVPEQVIDIVVATIRNHGWNVVRMLAPPAIFVERTDVVIDPGEKADESVREVAGELMDRVAETAYAAEAALDYVIEQRPQLADLPKAVIGGSAGAMSLPAVVKRDPEAYDAAVLIAGGANILDIVARSTYTRPVQALDFEWKGLPAGGPPDRAVLEDIAGAYLNYAPLDGYHAADALRGMPVLILHATGDDAVPADTGDLLWERLGEPERWLVPGTHLTLFFSLWLHTPRVMEWIEAQTAADVRP